MHGSLGRVAGGEVKTLCSPRAMQAENLMQVLRGNEVIYVHEALIALDCTSCVVSLGICPTKIFGVGQHAFCSILDEDAVIVMVRAKYQTFNEVTVLLKFRAAAVPAAALQETPCPEPPFHHSILQRDA